MNEILNYIQNNLLAIITAIAAIVALWQTHSQIKLSNKQFLFYERIDKLIIFKSLYELYDSNVLDYSDIDKNSPIISDHMFASLTNSEYLKDCGSLIIDVKNDDKRVNFLLKLEDMKKISYKIKYLFKGCIGKTMSEFIWSYQKVLLELYKYEIVNNNMQNDSISRNKKLSYKELQEQYKELTYRKELYKSIDKINLLHKNLKNNKMLEQVEKVIKI